MTIQQCNYTQRNPQKSLKHSRLFCARGLGGKAPVVLATGISSVWNAEFAGVDDAGVDNKGVGNLNTYVRNSLCSLKQTFSPE